MNSLKNSLMPLPGRQQTSCLTLDPEATRFFAFLKEIKSTLQAYCREEKLACSRKNSAFLKNNMPEQNAKLQVLSGKPRAINPTTEIESSHRIQQLNEENKKLKATMDELVQKQNQVIVQQKMATLSQVIASVTHEFNSPLGAIRSMNETRSKAVRNLQSALENKTTDAAAAHRKVNKWVEVILKADNVIEQGTERLSDTLNNLNNFGRLNKSGIQTVDIHEGIDSALALIQQEKLGKIEVTRKFANLPPIECDPRKLNQVFLNLFMNASQSIKGTGKITITTSLKEDKVSITIGDNGSGIAAKNLNSIFDPGFTTKNSVIRGSFELPLCYQIIQEHGGEICVESKLGEGTVFEVLLPR